MQVLECANSTSAAPQEGGDGGRDRIPLLRDFQARFLETRQIRRPAPITLWASVLALVSVVFAVALIAAGGRINVPLWVFSVLVVLSMTAEARPVRLTTTTEVSVSALPILFAAVAFGPLVAMAIGAAGVLPDFRRPYARWSTWTAMRALEGGLAGVAASLIADGSNSVGRLVGAVAIAALVEAHVDAGLAALTVRVRRQASCREFLAAIRPVLLATVPAYTPFVALLVYAYREISPWSLVLFFAPALAAHSLHKLYRQQREVTESLTEANVRLERANLSFAEALIVALDARDGYTAGHSTSVATYARLIAAELDLATQEQERAHLCGLVHDVGKVGLPLGILEKPGPLSPAEREVMEEHSAIGERILANVDDYADIAVIVRHHHERVDGAGYPDGLREEKIPLLSRIIAVADAYDAMTSARPYRGPLPTVLALQRLREGSGTQFDAMIVDAFTRALSVSRNVASNAVPSYPTLSASGRVLASA